MNNQYIKNIMGTRGWVEVAKMFKATIDKCRSEEIDESLAANEYKVIDMANKKVANELEKLYRNIQLAGGGDPKKNISYK